MITCDTQPIGVVTMAMEVLYNTCNMCICNFPDMKALGLQAYISGKFTMPMLQPLHACNMKNHAAIYLKVKEIHVIEYQPFVVATDFCNNQFSLTA